MKFKYSLVFCLSMLVKAAYADCKAMTYDCMTPDPRNQLLAQPIGPLPNWDWVFPNNQTGVCLPISKSTTFLPVNVDTVLQESCAFLKSACQAVNGKICGDYNCMPRSTDPLANTGC